MLKFLLGAYIAFSGTSRSKKNRNVKIIQSIDCQICYVQK